MLDQCNNKNIYSLYPAIPTTYNGKKNIQTPSFVFW